MRMFCFDLDDTLISESEYVESGLRAVGAVVDCVSRPPLAGAWLIEEWRKTRGRDLFQRLLSHRGMNVERWLPELISVYRNHPPEISLRPGAAELLETIVRCGDRLSLISDGALVAQRRKWEALQIEYPFDPVVFTDELGADYWKPNPWAFERVMSNCPPETQFIYVADNPEKDFVAPNRLGWISIRLIHPDNLHRGPAAADGVPMHQVLSFEELRRLVLGEDGQRLCAKEPEVAA